MNLKIVKEKYPTLFKALKNIAHDNGCINRLEAEECLPGIPIAYLSRLSELEKKAIAIGDDLYGFCCYSEFEVNLMIEKHDALEFHAFLDSWFETL